jgi:glycosyltransferase AglI
MNPFISLNFKQTSVSGLISVIIPVYKDVDGLRDTLDSLQKNSAPRNSFEIIVGNDGGSPEITKLCNDYGVIVVEVYPNQGSYTARNAALEISQGEYIAFVDADISVSENWIEIGIDALQSADYVGGAVLIDKAKLKTWAHYLEFATGFNNALKLEKFHYIPTANLFVKRTLIEVVGGFDRRLWSGGDVEFGNRVFDSGNYRMRFNEDLYVIHPPRGYKQLVKKLSRTSEGEERLRDLYPQRFKHNKTTILTPVRLLIQPLYKVVRSQKISFLKKVELTPFALWFGLVSVKCLFKM